MNDDIDDLEWQCQEHARRAEQAGLAQAITDSHRMRYGQVARELAREQDAPLPSNFAHAMSVRIEATARLQRSEQARFERAAFGWLAAVTGVGASAALVIYGRGWWSAIERTGWLGAPATSWLIALVVCGLLSQLLHRALRATRGAKH